MGQDYLDHFRNVFKSEIENGHFSSVEEYGDGDTMNEIRSFGFGPCYEVKADTKTLVFIEDTLTPQGEVDNVEWEGIYDELINPEGYGKREESAAFSVINVKRINIDFVARNKFHQEYIENVILRYVEQMMPSTALFSYKFVGQVFNAVPAYMSQGTSSGELRRAEVDAVMTDRNNEYLVEYPLPNTI